MANWTENKLILSTLLVAPFFLLFFSLRTNVVESSPREPVKKAGTKDVSQQSPLDKMSARELLDFGLSLYDQKKFQAALEIFEYSLNQGNESALLYNNICASHMALKDYENAIGYCQQALKLDPSFELAKSNFNFVNSKLEAKNKLETP